MSHPPSSYGIWFCCDSTPPTISLQLLLCLCMWGIFFGEFQCLPVDDCSEVSCESSVLERGSESMSFYSPILNQSAQSIYSWKTLNLMKQLWITKLWLWQIQGIGSEFLASDMQTSNQSGIILAHLLRPLLKYRRHLLRILKTTAWHNCFHISQMPLAKREGGWSWVGEGGYEGKDTEGREGATWKEISGALLLKIAIAELSLSQD